MVQYFEYEMVKITSFKTIFRNDLLRSLRKNNFLCLASTFFCPDAVIVKA